MSTGKRSMRRERVTIGKESSARKNWTEVPIVGAIRFISIGERK